MTTNLSSHGLNDSWKVMIFALLLSRPRSEVTELAVVSVICQPHLRTDEDNFLVVNDDLTVVVHILVYNWPSKR